MVSGLRYRALGLGGTGAITALVVVVANHPVVQRASMVVPVYNNLAPTTLANGQLDIALLVTLAVVLGSLFPLFKPRPRRILDVVLAAEKRVLLAAFALAAIGYFDYTYRLPRTTLVLTTVALAVAIPIWFVGIRRRPARAPERAILVGDDPGMMTEVLESADLSILGYVAPSGLFEGRSAPDERRASVDGGVVTWAAVRDDLERLGGLARLDEVLIENNVETAVLAFGHPDREEFFGTLDTCYEHGVTTKVHRDHADVVLTSDIGRGPLVDIELEPWDWQDYAVKRAFDVGFAAVGLLVLSPVMLAIAAAIKLDSPGPVLYSQTRTATFGDTFDVYKFRSMVPDAEADTGVKLSEEDAGGVDPRVTRVGRILRRTHLDEIPQLWSILVGDMSVVGPRPERPELDEDIESGVTTWRRRWFVKPGLTGLAQVNDVTGHEPEQKLRYDVAYIRQQSFWFDLKIVIRQIWTVLGDVRAVVASGE